MRDPLPFICDRLDEMEEFYARFLTFFHNLDGPAAHRGRPGVRAIVDLKDGTILERFLLMDELMMQEYLRAYSPNWIKWDTASRRNIAMTHRETEGNVCGVCIDVVDGEPRPVTYPCQTLLWLAWPYAEHFEYDNEWDVKDMDE